MKTTMPHLVTEVRKKIEAYSYPGEKFTVERGRGNNIILTWVRDNGEGCPQYSETHRVSSEEMDAYSADIMAQEIAAKFIYPDSFL